jgi:hypothetical protein
VTELDAMGFVWNVHDYHFSENIALLQRFREREGHLMVPVGWIEDGVPLGKRVSNLRTSRAKMASDRIAQLDALGFVWSVRGKASAPSPVLNGASPPAQLGDDDPHES